MDFLATADSRLEAIQALLTQRSFVTLPADRLASLPKNGKGDVLLSFELIKSLLLAETSSLLTHETLFELQRRDIQPKENEFRVGLNNLRGSSTVFDEARLKATNCVSDIMKARVKKNELDAKLLLAYYDKEAKNMKHGLQEQEEQKKAQDILERRRRIFEERAIIAEAKRKPVVVPCFKDLFGNQPNVPSGTSPPSSIQSSNQSLNQPPPLEPGVVPDSQMEGSRN